jgi:hypothetical protein
MRALKVLLAGASLLAAAASAAQAEEGEFMKDILGNIGIIQKERDPIQYRERAPLVIPPSYNLPSPSASLSDTNGQWPNDPDVAALKQKKSDGRTLATHSEVRRMQDRPEMSARELQAGRRAGAGIPDGPVIRRGDNSREEVWVHPEVLKAQGKRNRDQDDTTLLSGTEPPRRELTQPPTGYRAAAGGQKIKRDYEPVKREDESDTRGFLAQQAGRY